MKNVVWAEVGIAIAVGLVIGVSLPLLLYWLGLPAKLVGPLVGAFTAPAVGITYQIRMKKRQAGDERPE